MRLPLDTVLARVTSPVALLLVVGCAALGPVAAPGSEAMQAADGPAAPAAPGLESPAAAPPSQPSDSLVYKVLLAEIAGHRDRLDLAVSNYLEVARQTRDPRIAERATRIALYARDDAGALEAARIWADVAPTGHEAHRVLTGLYLKMGRVDDAVVELKGLFQALNATPAQSYALLVELLSRERDDRLAFAVMDRFIVGHETDVAAQLAVAHLAVRRGDAARATAILERVLALDPDDQTAVLLHTQVLQSQGRSEEALAGLGEAVARRPEDTGLRVAYARLLVAAKRYDDALREFRDVVSRNPENTEARYAMALLLLQTEQLEEAGRELRLIADAKGPRQVSARFYLGQIAETLERNEEAIDWYRQVDQGEHFLDAQVRYGVLLARQGRLDDARAHLQSVDVPGGHGQVRLYLVEAEILSDAGRYEDAMAIHDLALSEYPEDADLLYARAMLAEKMNRLDLLERDLRAILAKDPNHAQALNALGYTLADRTDRFAEAYDLIKRALDQRPDDYYILDSMGWVLYRMGRHPEALEHLQRARSLNDDPEIAAHLGEVLWVTGDREGARAVWRDALQRRPGDERVTEVMNRFDP